MSDKDTYVDTSTEDVSRSLAERLTAVETAVNALSTVGEEMPGWQSIREHVESATKPLIDRVNHLYESLRDLIDYHGTRNGPVEVKAPEAPKD